MGTPVAALVSHLERDIDAVGLYTPILGLNAMIARHLGRWGSSRDEFRELLESPVVAKLTSVIDPLAVDPAPPPQRRLIVGAWHDRMAMREPTTLTGRGAAVVLVRRQPRRPHILAEVFGVTERFLRDATRCEQPARPRGRRALQPGGVEQARLRARRGVDRRHVTRHEVGEALLLTHEEAVNRIIDHGRCSPSDST